MERPRAQSVLSIQPPHAQSRAERFFQKVSAFKPRIRLLTARKPSSTDSGELERGGPVKPYMSQPTLLLTRNKLYGPVDEDSMHSNSRGVPGPRESRGGAAALRPGFPTHSMLPSTNTHGLPSSQSLIDGLPTSHNGARSSAPVFVVDSDVVPNFNSSDRRALVQSSLPITKNNANGAPPVLPIKQLISTQQLHARADEITTPSNDTITPTPDRIIAPKQSYSRLSGVPSISSRPQRSSHPILAAESPPHSANEDSLLFHPNPRTSSLFFVPPRDASPQTLTSVSTLTAPTPESEFLTNPHPLSAHLRSRTVPDEDSPRTPSLLDHPSSSSPSASATVPSRRALQHSADSGKPLRHRFSLTLSDGGVAKLSPTIVSRLPPMVLNLPPLPSFAPALEESLDEPGRAERVAKEARRSSSLRLRSMPALPREGEGDTRAHPEGVEEEEGEDEEDEEEEEGNGGAAAADDGDGDGRGASIVLDGPSDDEGNDGRSGRMPRSSFSSDVSDGASVSGTSSYHTAHTPSLTQPSPHLLPSVDTSRLDMSFLDGFHDVSGSSKGKGKSREMNATDTTITPTMRTSRGHDNMVGNASGTSGDYFTSFNNNAAAGLTNSGYTTATTMGIQRTASTASSSWTPRPPDVTPTRFSAMIVSPGATPTPMVWPVGRPLPSEDPMRPVMYRQISKSLVDLGRHARAETVEEEDEGDAHVDVPNNEIRPRETSTAGSEAEKSNSPISTGVKAAGAAGGETVAEAQGFVVHQKRASVAPSYRSGTIRRQRSLPTFNPATLPPPYPDFAPHPHAHPMALSTVIQPREDEGRERLPPYSNSIYKRAVMPRKIEFTSPGVQARDRKWRRIECVLEGTALRIYRCPRVEGTLGLVENLWERAVGASDISSANHPTSGPGNGTNGANTNASAQDTSSVAPPAKLGVETGAGQTELVVKAVEPPPLPTTRSSSPEMAQSQNPIPTSRSKLNLAIQLLKPGRTHGRSISDANAALPTRPRSPRSSLNIPRPSFGSSNGTRSTGPTTSSQTPSIMTTTSSRGSISLSIPSSATSHHPHHRAPSPSHSSRSRSFSPGSGLSDGMPGSWRTKTPPPDAQDLIRQYTMQNAESGLANDYFKRTNVIRVRLEGEQFLLQAKDTAEVVEWIEALHSAKDVALDLDERPMPKGPLFPRRRRRRAAAAAAAVVPIVARPPPDNAPPP